MTITTVGIDLAKNVFAVHGEHEKAWGSHHQIRPAGTRDSQ